MINRESLELPLSSPPTDSSAVFGVAYNALRPAVRAYADNLRGQIMKIFQDHGVSDYKTFRALAMKEPKKISHDAIEEVQRLLQTMERVVTSQEVPKGSHEALYYELRERFGRGFIGMEEVEKAGAFTEGLTRGVRWFGFTQQQREHARQLLAEKFSEPDVKEFLHHISPEELQRDWLLILRVPKFNNQGKSTRDQRSLVTVASLFHRFNLNMELAGQGSLLFLLRNKVDPWVRTPFAAMHWDIVSREHIGGTFGVDYYEQEVVLREEAGRYHLDPNKIHRRSMLAAVYDYIVVLRATNEKIFQQFYDWTSDAATDYKFGPELRPGPCRVFVGGSEGDQSSGLFYDLMNERLNSTNIGATLSR